MKIDEYLAELERHLPRAHRRRLLSEAEEHLRDSAHAQRLRGIDNDAAEHAATEGFGAPSLVAHRMASVSALRDVRRAAALAVAAVAFLVFPLYGIPENTLPPARWDAKPADIASLQRLAIGFWLVALVFAVAGLGCSLSRHARFAVPLAMGAAGAVAGLFVVGVVLTVRWFAEAPWTPLWPCLGLALPISLACVGTVFAAIVWARSQARHLSPPLVQD